jgi:signal transduction histidine kinase
MSRPRLRNRFMLAFAAFTLVTAAVFGFYAVVFMYATEDEFFASLLRQEASAQHEHRERTGEWAEPRLPFLRVYAAGEALPDGLAGVLAQEPHRREAAGLHGRHYHLQQLHAAGADAWLVAEVSHQLVVRPMRERVLGWLAASALLLVALALLLGLLLARRVTGPLSRLAARVDGLTTPQLPRDFARGFDDDEVGTLARALQAMTGRIHDFIAREREFTRDASHELRTPLAVIRAAAERLDDEAALSPHGREHLQHLQQSVRQLQQTMDTLLALARAQAAPAGAAPLRVVPLVERVIVEQAALLDGKDVEVDVAVAASATTTIAAPVLHILLSNLIGNAFAHTARGRVTIDLDGSRLRIVNRGSAVATPAGADWFEPYAKREGSAGFGLGLDIVRRLGERCGLDLRIAFEADSASASFRLDPTAGDGVAAVAENRDTRD